MTVNFSIIRSLLFILLLAAASRVSAQSDTVLVTGLVYDADNPYIRFNYFMVNKRTGKGMFGDHKGLFQTTVNKRDTLVVSAKEYYPVKLVIRDSCYGKPACQVKVALRKREIQLLAVDIVPMREHAQISKDIKDLVEPSKIEKVTADAWNSPITALYQAFSKLEREKYTLHVLEAQDRKNEVLKELLDRYRQADIIDLDPEQYDEFLTISEFDTDYLATLDDYNLIQYVGWKYESYMRFMEFYNVFKRLYRNKYEFMLLEAQNQKMVIVTDVFKQFIDKDIWSVRAANPDMMFDFLNYANFNTGELIELNDYALIVTVKRKYDQYRGVYGSRR